MNFTVNRHYFFFMTRWLTIEVYKDWLLHLNIIWRGTRRIWCLQRGWHFIKKDVWHTPTNWWRTVYYDGYYQNGDACRFPEGYEYDSKFKGAVEWPTTPPGRRG